MIRALLLALLLAFGVSAQAEGVDVGKPSSLRNLVPAGAVEKQAAQQYETLRVRVGDLEQRKKELERLLAGATATDR